MFYNHKYNGEKMPSLEAVPNLEFWKQLPGLVKEGCFYSFAEGKEIAAMVRPLWVMRVLRALRVLRVLPVVVVVALLLLLLRGREWGQLHRP